MLLLQAVEGQVRGQLDDECFLAPLGICERRHVVDQGAGRIGGRTGIAGENVAFGTVEIGVVITEVEGEHLVGEAEADVPIGIVGQFDSGNAVVGEVDTGDRVCFSEPVVPDLTRDVGPDGPEQDRIR